MAASKVEPDLTRSDLIEVRRSNVHGLGVFAAQPIKKGTRIIEYVGERVSHDEADRRYEEKEVTDSHTFLFIVDSKTVIDAGVDGNDARFFNHSCNPNCESTVEKKRVYIEAIADIVPGAELTYDYQIHREDDDPDNIDEIFACRCGFPQCRGTMLWPTERKPKKAKKKKARAKTSGKGGSQAGKGGSSAKSRGQAKGKRAAAGKRGGDGKRSAAAKKKTLARKNARGGKNTHAKRKTARKRK
jgi:hypothetical protein